MDHNREEEKSDLDAEKIQKDQYLDLEELDSSLFEGVDIEPDEKEMILSRLVVRTIQKSYSGPLPDVETFKGYEEASAGAAKIILETFSEQSKHRQVQEKELLRIEGENRHTSYILNRNGQIFAFTLAVLAMLLSTYLIYLDKDLAGGIFGTTALIVVISLFIRGKSAKESQNEKIS